MKIFIIYLFLVSVSFGDAIFEEAKNPVRKGADFEGFYSSEKLSALGEISYSKGSGLKRDVIRLIVERSHNDIVLIKFYPFDDEFLDSKIEYKIFCKKSLVLKKQHERPVSKEVSNVIGQMIGESNPDTLPIGPYAISQLDGSLWILEFASEKEVYNICRKSPFSYEDLLKLKNVNHVREIWLSNLFAQLWTVSNVGEILY